MESKLEQLRELAKPLQDYLKENYDPYCCIEVEFDKVVIRQDIAHVPTEKNA